MNHWMVAPVLIPMMSAMACLLIGEASLLGRRLIGLFGVTASFAAALFMFMQVMDGGIVTYALGEWASPFGIVFVLDRLSGTMVLLTNVLAVCAYLYGISSDDMKGKFFHFLFLMQITGVNGAFLTGDAFNLFVFFEIMLLTAYVLCIYGGGPNRIVAGIRYVFLNLIGSALFLIGVGVLYGITGTLNMADMAVKASQVSAQDAMVFRAGAYLMLVVFAMKAALFPLYFWLPKSYSSVTAPVAAIFAIMTKVGVYALLRYSTLIFGEGRGVVENLLHDFLLPLALVSLVLATLAVLSSRSLRLMVAYMVVASVGTILLGIGLYTEAGIAASLYYLLHSTLISAALFLIADLISVARGRAEDRFEPAPAIRQDVLLGLLFMVGMIVACGLPPMSGFLGKTMILTAAIDTPWHETTWLAMLGCAFLTIVAAARGGTMLFWKTESGAGPDVQFGWRLAPVFGLLAALVALVVFAGPVSDFTASVAAEVMDPSIYIQAVLGDVQ